MIQTIDTNCPTCGAECTIKGEETKYYEPCLAYSEEEVKELLFKLNEDIYYKYGKSPISENSLSNWINENKKKA